MIGVGRCQGPREPVSEPSGRLTSSGGKMARGPIKKRVIEFEPEFVKLESRGFQQGHMFAVTELYPASALLEKLGVTDKNAGNAAHSGNADQMAGLLVLEGRCFEDRDGVTQFPQFSAAR